MAGNNELIKKLSEKIDALWEEIIIKEKLNNLTIILEEIKTNQTLIRQIMKEELKDLWNISEIPTFKLILEKLTNLEEEKVHKKIIKEYVQPSELVPINAWKRTKDPIMMDISNMKPQIPDTVNNILNKLGSLTKEGKF